MSSHPANIDLEPVIWARLIQAQKREISAEVARYLLAIEFGESDRERMQCLADRSEAGAIAPDEQAVFDSYLHIGNLLAVMQSKARRFKKSATRCRMADVCIELTLGLCSRL